MKTFQKEESGVRMISATSTHKKTIKIVLTTKYFYIGKWGVGITYPSHISWSKSQW